MSYLDIEKEIKREGGEGGAELSLCDPSPEGMALLALDFVV